MRLVKYLNLTISFLPVIWIITTSIAILDPIIMLGRFPVWRQDNVDMTFGRYFFASSIYLTSAILWSFPIWVSSAIFLFKKKKISKIPLLVYVIGLALCIYIFIFDPFGLLEWLYD